MKRWMLALLICATGAAQAKSACDKPKNDFDGLYCLNKVYQEADKALNDTYTKLAARLDADGKQRLKQGQLDWIKERNASCSRMENDEFFVNLECATASTEKRTRFLRDRVRECAGGGCKDSKL